MMRFCIAIFTLVFGISAYAQQAPARWMIDNTRSKIGFSIEHMAISEVTGTFQDFNGTMQISTDDFTQSKVTFKISAASVNTEEASRDAELRSVNFFNVGQYPYIEFTSTAIERKADGSYLMRGNMTMHGITKPIALDIRYQSVGRSEGGQYRLGFQVTGAVNRLDFGLNWNQFADNVVGNKVNVNCFLELVRG